MAEKIFSGNQGRSVKAGDILIANVDATMMHDINSPSVVSYFESMGEKGVVKSVDRHMLVLDHLSPCSNLNAANSHKRLRDFARKHGIRLVDTGSAICHQALMESGKVRPGSVVIATDSHTPMAGALNAIAPGVGAAELSVALATDKCWFKVPESILVKLSGKPAPKVTAKDISLRIIELLEEGGAAYQCIEFAGDALAYLSVDERAALCNMMAETGAKCAITPCDEVLEAWFKSRGIADVKGVSADADAGYVKVIEIDASAMEPLLAAPPRIDNVKPVREFEGVRIQQVFIGSCTNGRLEDLTAAAAILKGKKIHPNVRLILGPASREIELGLVENGAYQALLAAGGVFNMPGCGPCGGLGGGLIGDGESAFATSNRNLPGRMGSESGDVYIGSAVIAAYTALAGHITVGGDA